MILEQAAGAALVYFFLLFAARLLARGALSRVPADEMLVLLILAEAVDDLVLHALPAWKGGLILAVMGAWHLGHAWQLAAPRPANRKTGPREPLAEGPASLEAGPTQLDP